MMKIEPNRFYSVQNASGVVDLVFAVGACVDMSHDGGTVALELEDWACLHASCLPPSHQGLGVYHVRWETARWAVEITAMEFLDHWLRLTAPTFEAMRKNDGGPFLLNFKKRWMPPPDFNYNVEDVICGELAARGVGADVSSAGVVTSCIVTSRADIRSAAEPCVCFGSRSRLCRAHEDTL